MLLALHTCGTTAGIALGQVTAPGKTGGIRILAQAELAERTHAARLLPEIAALLDSQKVTVADLEAIVVVNGPGSFTGIRIGLGTAKGLCEAAGIPLLAVSRLGLLAFASGLPHVLVAVDAGRGDYYFGEYRNAVSLGEVLLTGPETVAMAKKAGAGVLVCDETPARVGDENTVPGTVSACSALAICGPVYVQAPGAAEALRFALPRFLARDFDDVAITDANYLRRPDAELLLAAKGVLPVVAR